MAEKSASAHIDFVDSTLTNVLQKKQPPPPKPTYTLPSDNINSIYSVPIDYKSSSPSQGTTLHYLIAVQYQISVIGWKILKIK